MRYNENEIEILMEDKCTKSEAEKFLEHGTIILKESEVKEHFEDFLREWLWGVYDSDDIEEEKKNFTEWIFNDGYMQDCTKVEHEGIKYCIIYSL